MSQHTTQKMDGLTRLRLEKNKLQTFCTYQEKLIGLKTDYFRNNYSELLGEAMLPYDRVKNRRTSKLLDSVNDLITNLLPEVFEGKFLPGFLLKLVQILSIWTFRKAKS